MGVVETKGVSGILADFMWGRKIRHPRGSQHVAHLLARSLRFPVEFSLDLDPSTSAG